jgi:hypothetical protein
VSTESKGSEINKWVMTAKGVKGIKGVQGGKGIMTTKGVTERE